MLSILNGFALFFGWVQIVLFIFTILTATYFWLFELPKCPKCNSRKLGVPDKRIGNASTEVGKLEYFCEKCKHRFIYDSQNKKYQSLGNINFYA